MTKDKIIEMAKQAGIRFCRNVFHSGYCDGVCGDELEAFAALVREDALAQPAPVQEPVAWMDVDEKGAISGLRYWSEPDNRHEVALYTTPPQRTWVELTEQERNDLEDYCEMIIGKPAFDAIEAKLKGKNT